MAEYLYHFLSVQHFLDKAVHGTQIDLLADIISAGQLGEIRCDKQHDHCSQYGDHRKRRVQDDHRDQCGRHRDD